MATEDMSLLPQKTCLLLPQKRCLLWQQTNNPGVWPQTMKIGPIGPTPGNRKIRKIVIFLIFWIFCLFWIFKRVLEVREAFQWIRDAILLFPEVSRPQDHFSGSISHHIQTCFDMFRDFDLSKSNYFRKSRSHVVVLILHRKNQRNLKSSFNFFKNWWVFEGQVHFVK